ncbi:hypothetical protein [Kiloniella sp.]|uniref:hypothetical protein n=1 Tax=Kiloniella sp. TaxID=1938587 RepID=UPI003A8E8F60
MRQQLNYQAVLNCLMSHKVRLTLAVITCLIHELFRQIIVYSYSYLSYGSLEIVTPDVQNISLYFYSTIIYFIIGFVILPHFVLRSPYRPLRAFFGGTFALTLGFFLSGFAYLVTSGEIEPLRYILFSQNLVLILDFLNLLLLRETVLYPLIAYAVTGGIMGWIAHKLVFLNRVTSSPALSEEIDRNQELNYSNTPDYIPTRFNTQLSPTSMRLYSSIICGVVALLLPFIILTVLNFVDGRSFSFQKDISIEILMLLPGCLFFGFILLPHFLTLAKFKPRRAFFGGTLVIAIANFITGLSVQLYKVPFAKIIFEFENNFDQILYGIAPIALAVLLGTSIIGSIVIYCAYRFLFTKKIILTSTGVSIFD